MSNPINLKLADQFLLRAKYIADNDHSPNSSFRIKAYKNTAFVIRGIEEDISNKSEKELMKYKGIGKNSAVKIIEFFKSKDQTIPESTIFIDNNPKIVKPKKITINNMNPVFAVLSINTPVVKWNIQDQKTMDISCICKKPNGKTYKINGINYKSEFDRMYTMLSGVCKVLSFDKKNTIKGECARYPFQIRMSWC
jgi:hypothetical protein